MVVRRLCVSLAAALIVGLPADSTAVQVERNPEVSEIRVQVDDASLYSGRSATACRSSSSTADPISTTAFVTIPDCGHFAYLECAREVRDALDDFVQGHVETQR